MFFWRNTIFAKNILLANFSKKLTEPYKITLSITDQCNSRCKICNIWKKKVEKELTLDEIKKILKNLKTDWINITGGEPFLRKDLIDILALIKREVNPALINISTNGLMPQNLKEKIQKIKSLNLPKVIISVSLDGPPKIHNKIRGVDDSWEKAVQTFAELKQLEKDNNFKVFFGYTISKYNLGHFNETLESVKNIIPKICPNDWHINIFQTSSHYYDNSDDDSTLDQEKLLAEINEIQKIRRLKISPVSFLESIFLRGAKEFIKTTKTPLPCSALLSSCFINSSGAVYPCIHYNKKLGKLKENNYELLKIWNNIETNKIRGNIINNKCPDCWTSCEANPTILNNLLKKPKKWIFR